VQTELSLTPFFFRDGRRPPWRALTRLLLAATVAGAILTGCESTPSRKKHLLERIQPPQPVLSGTAVFGGGALTVESWLGPSVRLKKTNDQKEPGEHPGHDGRPRPWSDSTLGNHREGSDDPFTQGASDFTPHEIDEMYGRVDFDYVEPTRLALTFTFINPGAQPVTFTIADVNSTLGNFAPRPEVLTVAPGEHGSIDPMLSNITSNFDELAVTLTVKIRGQTETHILNLRRAGEPPAPPRQD